MQKEKKEKRFKLLQALLLQTKWSFKTVLLLLLHTDTDILNNKIYLVYLIVEGKYYNDSKLFDYELVLFYNH